MKRRKGKNLGEKIRDLSNFTVGKAPISVELNKAEDDGDDYVIHIESSKFRCAMSDKEFMKMVVSVMEAERKLQTRKLRG